MAHKRDDLREIVNLGDAHAATPHTICLKNKGIALKYDNNTSLRREICMLKGLLSKINFAASAGAPAPEAAPVCETRYSHPLLQFLDQHPEGVDLNDLDSLRLCDRGLINLARFGFSMAVFGQQVDIQTVSIGRGHEIVRLVPPAF